MSADTSSQTAIPRRDFIKLSAATMGAGAVGFMETAAAPGDSGGKSPWKSGLKAARPGKYNGIYSGDRLNRVAFPMGGIGAGMICLEGTGALSHFSLRNRPDVYNEPCTFAAVSIKGKKHDVARVLEGQVPAWKLYGAPGSSNGAAGASFGLPRFRKAEFQARFPFAVVRLEDKDVPVSVEITGWSPFEPGDADNSSLPVAALEYRFTNFSGEALEMVFSFNAKNFMVVGGNAQAVKRTDGGFILWGGAPPDKPWEEGAFSATLDGPGTRVNCAWFRGGWWDPLTMAWKDIESGACYDRPPVTEGGASPGATLFSAFRLEPESSKTVVLKLAWYAGKTNLRIGKDPAKKTEGCCSPEPHRPWYAERFANIDAVTAYWRGQIDVLREKSARFRDCFYDSTLPPEVLEAVAANLTILKSPTVLREHDGRLWGWEGCCDGGGCCHGTCTHVWNYAQAIPHLFPDLERSLRETEFGPSQDERGHQQFRSALPIRPLEHDFHAAADGQLGGIIKMYREWRISGDSEWVRRLWPTVKKSLDFCIETWDPDRKGWLEEPHHNTYDIEFWGPDGMCTSFYLAALKAAVQMGEALGEDVSDYAEILKKGVQRMETDLYNGEYFIQKIEWKNLRAPNPLNDREQKKHYSPEALALLEKEGPKYQYGNGCLSDGVLGCWMAAVCGLDDVVDRRKVASHLLSVFKYNFKADLSGHANPQRPTYACGAEGGLLLCSWPKGDALSLPFVYSNEVWTGIEYQAASHLMLLGRVEEGLTIVRACRDRYDGRIRNPFNEYECGHWYARAMSSYGMLQGLTGARYDAVEKTLHVSPSIKGDFRSFFATATGYGTVGVKNGKPFLDVKAGRIEVRKTVWKEA